jgi:hypothetical protein
MKNWKNIAGGLAGAIAVFVISSPAVLSQAPTSNILPQVMLAWAQFFSFVILHWLLWRLIISARPECAETTAFFRKGAPSGFLSGTIGAGYLQIGMYCAAQSGLYSRGNPTTHIRFLDDPTGRSILLFLGLLMISLGTAGRLREVFLKGESRTAQVGL